jgi:hypothetical protein
MDHDRMLAVLANLADGIDPASGTAFPADSPYQHPETVRALFLAIRRLEAARSAGTSMAARSAGTSMAARSAGTSMAARSAGTSMAAGSAGTSTAAGSAGVPTGAGSSDVRTAAGCGPTEAPRAGRKPSASGDAASKGGNAGKAWTAEEDQRLAAAFDAGSDIDALTKLHGRSRLALEIRLAKLGRLPMPEKTLYGNKLQELPQAVSPADPRPTKARSASGPRRASESGGLRYHVAKSIAAAGLRV